jgi:hypothetical protein
MNRSLAWYLSEANRLGWALLFAIGAAKIGGFL